MTQERTYCSSQLKERCDTVSNRPSGVPARFISPLGEAGKANCAMCNYHLLSHSVKASLCWVLYDCYRPYLHSNSTQMLQPHFTQEKTETQRDWVFYPRFLSMEIAELESNPIIWLHALSTISECRWSPVLGLGHSCCWRSLSFTVDREGLEKWEHNRLLQLKSLRTPSGKLCFTNWKMKFKELRFFFKTIFVQCFKHNFYGLNYLPKIHILKP